MGWFLTKLGLRIGRGARITVSLYVGVTGEVCVLLSASGLVTRQRRTIKLSSSPSLPARPVEVLSQHDTHTSFWTDGSLCVYFESFLKSANLLKHVPLQRTRSDLGQPTTDQQTVETEPLIQTHRLILEASPSQTGSDFRTHSRAFPSDSPIEPQNVFQSPSQTQNPDRTSFTDVTDNQS